MGYHQRYSGIYSTMVWKKSRCFYWKGTDWVSYCHYLQGTPGTPKINEPWFIHPRLTLYQIHLDMGRGYNAILTIDSIYNFWGYFYPQVLFYDSHDVWVCLRMEDVIFTWGYNWNMLRDFFGRCSSPTVWNLEPVFEIGMYPKNTYLIGISTTKMENNTNWNKIANNGDIIVI